MRSRNPPIMGAWILLQLVFASAVLAAVCRVGEAQESCASAPGCAAIPECSAEATSVSCQSAGLTSFPVLPAEVQENVITLDLEDNLITSLQAQDLENFVNLTELTFGNNGLQYIEPGSFSTTTQLRRLHLNNNNLMELPHDLFANLTQLEILDLDSNNLMAIPRNLFANLTQLEILDLEDNQIHTIAEGAFPFTESRLHIVLTENPLRCDCELSWIPDYIVATFAAIPGTCAAPEHIRGRFVNSLQEEEFVCVAVSCRAEDTIVDTLENIVLHWPESNIGDNVTLPCPRPCGNFNFSAYRYCGGDFITGAMWEEPLQMECVFTEATSNLCQTADPTVDVMDTVQQLEDITEDEEMIEAMEVAMITTLPEEQTEAVAEAQDINVTTTFLTVVDNLLDADREELEESQRMQNTSARLLQTIERVAEEIPIEENETMAVISLTSFIVAVQEVQAEELEFHQQIVSVLLGNESNFDLEEGNDDSLVFRGDPNAAASITIPSSVFMNLSGIINMNETLRVTHTVFLTDTLFVRGEESSQEVGSIIISASIVGHPSLESIDPPIMLTFLKTPKMADSGKNTTCNFWNPTADGGFGDWSTRGCWLANETNDVATCRCNHLTNFAILLDVSPGNVNQTAPAGVTKTLEALSFLGAAVSICCLTVTIITYLGSKKLRSSKPGQLLINLCIGLLGIYVMYIVAIYATAFPPLCALSGALLHYFFLATFILMAAEAINLYIKIVVIMGVKIEKYALKAGIIAWVLPLVFITGVSLATDYDRYAGTDLQFCRPYGIPYYVGLLGPILLIYIFNWIVFITIMGSLVCKRKSNETRHRLNWRKQLIIATTLSLLFGLGWGFGLPATESIDNVAVRTTFQLIFIILTGFHGLFIFALYCLRNAEVRKEWRKWSRAVTCLPEDKHIKHKLQQYRKPVVTQSKTASTPKHFRVQEEAFSNNHTTLTIINDNTSIPISPVSDSGDPQDYYDMAQLTLSHPSDRCDWKDEQPEAANGLQEFLSIDHELMCSLPSDANENYFQHKSIPKRQFKEAQKQ